MIHFVALQRIPVRRMQAFVDAIASHGDRVKVTQNVWLVDTMLDASDLFHELRPYIDDADSLLVMRVRAQYGAYLPLSARRWIRAAVARGAF